MVGNNNDVSVVDTGDGYVVSFAFDRNGDQYHTLVSDSLLNCGRANDIGVTHVLKSKILTTGRYEELVSMGQGALYII
ncbi:MAG: hypothetical protein KatS3mg084_0180 [Candidatus Dojkabacteria bacterium]|nr:MAG: hypothetical protein KatS3mg084_0180 [Candidatus Dojkabacteria bacterium]